MIAMLEEDDLTTLELEQLIGSLITHEMINPNEDKAKKKKKKI